MVFSGWLKFGVGYRWPSFSSRFPIRRDRVRVANGVTPALFALIQSLNQFLNELSFVESLSFVTAAQSSRQSLCRPPCSPPIFRCECKNEHPKSVGPARLAFGPSPGLSRPTMLGVFEHENRIRFSAGRHPTSRA